VDVRFELDVRAVMVALNGRLLERSVHPLNLTIGPRMVWLRQPVLDAVRVTEHVEHMGAPACRRSETILWQIGELDAVVGEHGMDFVRDRFDQGFEELRSDPAIGFLM
jgi:hypothetical protein